MSGLSRPSWQQGRYGFSRNTNHGLHGSRLVRHFIWSGPGPRQWFSRNTRHESRNTAFMLPYPRFPTISRHFPVFPAPPPPPRSRVRAPFASATRPVGFSRHTRHESRTLPPPGRCFPARCGAAWGGYGAAWAAAAPRSGNKACWVFTSHEARNMVFPCPSSDSKESSPKPGQRVFTNHESRNTNHGFYDDE